MYFIVTHSSIYNWKGHGTGEEQTRSSLPDSFCHLIIAREATTKRSWMLLIDQGEDTGISTTNCIEYIIPRICEEFSLETSGLKAFEVWPHHRGEPELKYTEIVISDISLNSEGDKVLKNAWRPAQQEDVKILEQLVETVGDKVIREDL